MSATPVLGISTSSTDDGADQPSPPESAPRSSVVDASGPSEGGVPTKTKRPPAASDSDSDSSLAAAPPAVKRSRASEASDRPRPEGEELNGTPPPQTVLTVGMRVRCCFDRAPRLFTALSLGKLLSSCLSISSLVIVLAPATAWLAHARSDTLAARCALFRARAVRRSGATENECARAFSSLSSTSFPLRRTFSTSFPPGRRSGGTTMHRPPQRQ